MKRLRSFLGWTWAALALPIVLLTFMGNARFSQGLADVTGITVSPRFNGGEVVTTQEHPGYRTLIHRPVFDGLFGERTTGFIQIDWEQGPGTVPAVIEESVNLKGPPRIAFTVKLDTSRSTAELTRRGPSSEGVESVYRLNKGWAVRIALKKE